MPQQDVLNVLLQVRNLRRFVGSMGEASAAVRGVGRAGAASTAQANATGAAWAGAAGLVSRGMKATAFAAAAAGYEAIKMGVNFDNMLTRIETTTGAMPSEVSKIREHILGMNSIFSPQQLAEAARYIEAIGIRAPRALEVLDNANEGAALSGANVVETARTLAGIMRVEIPGAMGTAAEVMAKVNAAVGTGAISLDEFNHAMGQGVLPVAKEYGLTFDDIIGALDVFTDEHIKGSSSMAQLATALHFLTGSSKRAEDALTHLGMSGHELTLLMRKPNGLMLALADLKKHMDATFGTTEEGLARQVEALDKILPGGRGRILRVLMNQIDVYNQKLSQNKAVAQNYAHAVDVYHQTAAYKIGSAWRKVQQDLIKLYDNIKGPGVASIVAILHVAGFLVTSLTNLTDGAGGLSDVVVPLAAAFIAYKFAVLGAAAAEKSLALQTAIGGVIRLTREVGLLTAATALFDSVALANPIGIIALGIAALVAIIVMLIMHWQQVKDAGVAAWNWIKQAFVVAFNFITSHLEYLWAPVLVAKGLDLLVGYITSRFHYITDFISGLPSRIASAASGMWDGIKDAFRAALNWIIKQWNHIHLKLGATIPILNKHVGVTLSTPNIPYLASGGDILSGGMAVVGDRGPELVELPTGARVNRHQPTFGSSATGGGELDLTGHIKQLAKSLSKRPFSNNIYMDGKLFYRTMSQYAADGQARG